MKKNTLFIIAALLFGLFLTACGSTETEEPTEVEAPAETTTTEEEASEEVVEEEAMEEAEEAEEVMEEEAAPEEAEEMAEEEAVEEEAEEEAAVDPIVLTDGLGNTVELAGPAQRIVSLAPSNTEILFAVGAGEQVVGRDSFSDYPETAFEVTDIGGGFAELDMETIISLEPDLVLAADITAPEQIQALADVDLTVFALTNPVDIAGMYENLRTVAALTGHTEATEDLIVSLEERVTAVSDKIAAVEEKPLVFYEIDGTDPNAPWTTGEGTFVDTLINMAGGQNVAAVLEGSWIQISIEELIVQDPELILLGDALWGGVTPESVAAREGWGALTAVNNNNVHPFNDNLVSRPGPRLVDGLEEMAAFLHPDLFE